MVIEHTLIGPQYVLPGAERASDATMAQGKADAPMRPKVPQKPVAGLFGDDARQLDLIDTILVTDRR